jgi:DNA (cytosine-5)-methyltransferase 1
MNNINDKNRKIEFKSVEEFDQFIPNLKKPNLKVVTLFSGYGSQELALKYLGLNYEVIANSDIDKKANEVYDTLHKTTKGNLGDIKKINEENLPDCDLLTYSFPCTSVSKAGKQEGIAPGTPSGLLLEVERLLAFKQPEYLLMENVANLVSKKHKPSFQRHLEFLHSLGYATYYRVLNAVDFGCAQNRKRVLMMAQLNGCTKTIKRKMKDLDYHTEERLNIETIVDQFADSIKYLDFKIIPHQTSESSICKTVAKIEGVNYQQTARIYSIYGASPCITKTIAPKIIDKKGKIRRITAREGYRLMGVKENDIDLMFQTSLSENQHLALAGNSICIPVLEAIFYEFFYQRDIYSMYSNMGLKLVA